MATTRRKTSKKPTKKTKASAKKPVNQPLPAQAYPLADDGREITKDRAILALILNVLVLPGLGTLVAGKINNGLIQLLLTLLSIPLMFFLIGFPLALGMWIWALVTGIDLVTKSR